MVNFIRSPHILEVLVGYGTVHIITLYLFSIYNMNILYGYLFGSILYTFIEYWFHRVILHEWIFKQAHKFHHDNPIKLKIITVPLLPVQLYEIFLMMMISIYDYKLAILLQLGISISQIIMDYVHVFEHSKYNPWFLKVARNFHKLHHNKTNWDLGHGLTSRFWDLVFQTYPNNWTVQQKYPWSKFLTVPIPLLDFLLLQPILEDENLHDNSSLILPSLSDVKIKNLVIAFISGIVVGFSPFYVGIISNYFL